MGTSTQSPYTKAITVAAKNGARYLGRDIEGRNHRIRSRNGKTVYLVNVDTFACTCSAHRRAGICCYSIALALQAVRAQSTARLMLDAEMLVRDVARNAATAQCVGGGRRLYR